MVHFLMMVMIVSDDDLLDECRLRLGDHDVRILHDNMRTQRLDGRLREHWRGWAIAWFVQLAVGSSGREGDDGNDGSGIRWIWSELPEDMMLGASAAPCFASCSTELQPRVAV